MAEDIKNTEVELVEVPVQYAPAFKIGNEVLDEKQLLMRIYNDIQTIKKTL